MKNTTVVSILFLIITPLSGCVFYPGQHLDLAGKKIIAAEDANDRLEKRIDVYPLTPSLIEKMRPSVLKSQANPNLDEQVKNWEYRIGVGDILTVTVWDHPELTTPVIGSMPTARFSIPMSVNCRWLAKRSHGYARRSRPG